MNDRPTAPELIEAVRAFLEAEVLPALGDNARLRFQTLVAVNVLALFLLLVPGVNLIAFYIGNGYLLGREYFELAAMRHIPSAEARSLRKANRGTVFLAGLIIAGLASVPILNFLTPLFATGFMVRVFKSIARQAAGGFASIRVSEGASPH